MVSKQIDILLQLQANIEAANDVRSALASINAQAATTAKQLELMFNPATTNRTKEFKAAIGETGAQLREFAIKGAEAGGASQALANQMGVLSQRMERVGVTNRLASVEYDRLLKSIQDVNATWANQQTVAAANAAELDRVASSAQKAGKMLEQAFTPRLIQSHKQLQTQLFQSARALENWLAQGVNVTKLTPQLTAEAQALAARMIELSSATNISNKEFAELQAQMAAIQPVAQAANAVFQQGASGLQAQQAGLEKVNSEMGSFTPNATAAQKAGQGLILSFSASQLAAGNFSQAMFGMGFSLLFVGKGMLDMLVIVTALGAAVAGIGLDKLTASMKSDTVPVLQKVNEQMSEFKDLIAEVRGEQEETVRAFESLIDTEGAVISLTVAEEELIKKNEELLETAEALARGFIDEAPILTAIENFDSMSISGDKINSILAELGGPGVADVDEFAAAILAASGKTADLRAQLDNVGSAAARNFQAAAAEARAAFADFEQGVIRGAEDRALSGQFEGQAGAVREHFDNLRQIEQDAAQAGSAAAASGSQARQRALRQALQDQLDIEKERIDVIKDALSEETRLIREATEDVVVLRRRALADQLTELKSQADARVDAIKDEATRELDINKDRIKELGDQEKELTDQIANLTKRRQDAISDILTTEAEIAALEQLRRGQGADPSLEQELRLREARLSALEEEQQAMEDQIGPLESQQDTIEKLIEQLEDRGDQIKKNRDLAISAIRDELSEAQTAARRRSDDEIRAINRTRDADIRASQDAADIRIERIEDVMDALRRQNEDQLASIQSVSSAQGGANRARLAQLNKEERFILAALAAQERQAQEDVDRIRNYADNVQPILEKIIRDFGLSFSDLAALLRNSGLTPELISLIIGGFVTGNQPDPGLFSGGEGVLGVPESQFAGGGMVKGREGQAQLAVVHGGEEVLTRSQQRQADDKAAMGGGQTVVQDRRGTNAGQVLTVILEATGNSASSSEMRKLKRALNRSFGQDIEVHLRSRRLIG